MSCKLFADDIKLYTAYNTAFTHNQLVIATNRLICWANTCQLILAAEKCTVNRIHSDRCKPVWGSDTPVYKINNSILNFTDNIRDLGIIIDHGLKFEKHISSTVHKAHVRAKLILKCFNSRDRSLLVKGFCTYVRPLVEYCTPVWNPHYNYLINKIESVQRHFTKRVNGLKNVPYNDRLKSLGLQSLERRRLNFDLILVYKILHGLTDTELSTNLIYQNQRPLFQTSQTILS